MIKESKMYKILSFIHLIFITSIFLGIVTILSLGILFLPALTAVFYLGKKLMYGEYNVYDGIFKILFRKLKEYMYMLRFIPVKLLILMQFIGIYVAGLQDFYFLQIILLSSGAFLLVYIFYICGYEIFIGGKYTALDVAIAMFYKITYFLSLWILGILSLLFFQLALVKYLLIINGILILPVEFVVFLGLIMFKKASGTLENDFDKGEGRQS